MQEQKVVHMVSSLYHQFPYCPFLLACKYLGLFDLDICELESSYSEERSEPFILAIMLQLIIALFLFFLSWFRLSLEFSLQINMLFRRFRLFLLLLIRVNRLHHLVREQTLTSMILYLLLIFYILILLLIFFDNVLLDLL
jgi:hypothetical protein